MKPLTILAALLAVQPLVVCGQEKSVNPGINKTYEHPNVADSIQRFESNGRDVFDHRHEIVSALNLKPGVSVADIGAGTGLFTRLFSPEVGPTGRVFAVDIAQEFIDHIEDTARQQKLDNIIGHLCKQDSVELPANSIDLAFICDTYHHFEYPRKTLQSIYTALKPQGQLVLIDYRRVKGESSDWVMGHVRAGQEVFTKEIEEAGFRQIEEKKDVLKESYFLRFQRISEN
jgi:ubiquinone/menaquinone biosynthesis C-methylase UbiE